MAKTNQNDNYVIRQDMHDLVSQLICFEINASATYFSQKYTVVVTTSRFLKAGAVIGYSYMARCIADAGPAWVSGHV